MNITDVDDKIILGARYKYLFDQYVSKTTQKEDAIPVIHEALNEWIQEKIGGKEIFDKAIEGVYPEGKDVKFDLYVKTAVKSFFFISIFLLQPCFFFIFFMMSKNSYNI